jgi:signal transduction histidine kinase
VWVLVAAVLHELNNPLHALGLLLDEQAACTDDEARRADLVERARAQAERALSHLRVLRSMRSTGEPELQRVALDRILGSLAGEIGSLAAEDGLVLRVDCAHPVQVTADPTYVRTILENLVDNGLQSLRGGGVGGSITIRLAVEGGLASTRA